MVQMPVNAIIIDDSATARYIRHQLVKLGCVVAGEAINALEGLKLFREIEPAIVTLDLVMPKHDGVDAMQALRTMKKEDPYTIIIVISTLGIASDVEDYLKEGIFDYIVKPISEFSFDPIERKLRQRFPGLIAPPL
jgi:CheY-like chemotaxis protein